MLELHARGIPRLGPDILERPPRIDEMAARIRRGDGGRAVGDAILDQRLVAGIGNKWKAEALWEAQVSPWRAVSETSDEQLHSVLDAAARLMRDSLDGRPRRNRVYRLVGRPCSRCGERILSRGQGDDNRIAYWCPGCQPRGQRQIRAATKAGTVRPRSLQTKVPFALRTSTTPSARSASPAFAQLGPEVEQGRRSRSRSTAAQPGSPNTGR